MVLANGTILDCTGRDPYPGSTVVSQGRIQAVGPQAVEIAVAAGLKITSGTDAFGPYAPYRALELELKAAVMGPMAAIQSATVTNAELLGIQEDVGTLEQGKLADVISVEGDPLADIALFQDKDKIALVMQSGDVVKGEF